jgi:hypothetical protein
MAETVEAEVVKVKKIKKGAIIDGASDIMVAALIEKAEKEMINAEFEGQLVNKFVYEFEHKIKNKNGEVVKTGIVRDLTVKGFFEVIRKGKDGFVPDYKPPVFTTMEGGRMMVTIQCQNPKTGETVFGSCDFDPRDKFSRSCTSIAQRNALKLLVPEGKRQAFILYCLSKRKDLVKQIDWNRQEAKKELIGEDAVAIEKAIASLFAKLNEIGVSKDAWHVYMKKQNNVQSLKDIKLNVLRQTWKEIAALKGKPDEIAMYNDMIKGDE